MYSGGREGNRAGAGDWEGAVRLRMCLSGGGVVGARTGLGACRECSGRKSEASIMSETTDYGDGACIDGAGVGRG
jgi:hypothetical protein